MSDLEIGILTTLAVLLILWVVGKWRDEDDHWWGGAT